EVRAQEIRERQERRGLAVRHRACLEHEPAFRVMRVQELVEQARLADAGLADDGDDLSAAAARLRGGRPDLLHLRVAPDELRESSRPGRLQPRADDTGAG